jgi:hypothetical protein
MALLLCFFFRFLCFYRLKCGKNATGEKGFDNIRKENFAERTRFVYKLCLMCLGVFISAGDFLSLLIYFEMGEK